MATFRSRRLEGIFGAQVDAVDSALIQRLVEGSIAESYDLDFKSELYAATDKGRHSLAVDVAALANTAGGLIILGITEDDQARAMTADGVQLGDAEVGRMRLVVASQVAPMPTFDIRQVEHPNDPAMGYFLITVPPGARAPHAVLVNQTALRYPRRNGSTTTYLSEAEVAAAYLARFENRESRARTLTQVEAELLSRMDGQSQTFVVLSLVPDAAGDFLVDSASRRSFVTEVSNRDPHILGRMVGFEGATVGSRRLVATGSPSEAGLRYLGAELHETGAGSFASIVADPKRRRSAWDVGEKEELLSQIHDEDMVNVIMSGLRFLGRHARDRAAVSGGVTVRGTIWPIGENVPAEIVHQRGDHNLGGRLGTGQVVRGPVAVSSFEVDDLAEDGPGLVRSTYEIATGLLQHFGVPEVPQFSADGAVRARYWRNAKDIRSWAESSGVDVSDETI